MIGIAFLIVFVTLCLLLIYFMLNEMGFVARITEHFTWNKGVCPRCDIDWDWKNITKADYNGICKVMCKRCKRVLKFKENGFIHGKIIEMQEVANCIEYDTQDLKKDLLGNDRKGE